MAISRRTASTPKKKITKPESLESERRDHRGQLMTFMSLRVPTATITAIEKILKHRPGRVSRNTFIIEALEEKVERERA